MKKFLLLLLIALGINTAVEAQTRLQFSDEKGNVIEYLEFEKTLSPEDVQNLFNDLNKTSNTTNSQIGGSFRLDVWYQYYPGSWSHEYGGPFFWYQGETLGDIIDRIIAIYF